jgi:hypothetical protein
MNTKESFEIEVNNEVLKWAINTSGWDTSKLAEKVGISEDYFNKVLNNEKKLTITQGRYRCFYNSVSNGKNFANNTDPIKYKKDSCV